MIRKPPWEGYGQMMLLKALNGAVKVDIEKRNPVVSVFCSSCSHVIGFLLPHCSLS